MAKCGIGLSRWRTQLPVAEPEELPVVPMSGHGPWVALAPAGGVVVVEDPVPDELPVPVDAVEEPEPDVEVDELAGVVVDVAGCDVAAPDARVPTPTPSPAVPPVTASATSALRNRECMVHLSVACGEFPRDTHDRPSSCEPAVSGVGGN